MKTQAESAMRSLVETLNAKFFYNPISKVTAVCLKPIWEYHVAENGKAEGSIVNCPDRETFNDRSGNLRYIDRKTKQCTPLQAYLLEFNSGYRRLK